MEMIIISKGSFDLFFEHCMNKLKIETFQDMEYVGSHKQNFINLHRKFHYEIAILKTQLEKGE